MKHTIQIAAPNSNKQRLIVVDGFCLGSVTRVAKTDTHKGHWVGSIRTHSGEYWRVSGNNTEEVYARVEEALV